jgi:hypothetical protein
MKKEYLNYIEAQLNLMTISSQSSKKPWKTQLHPSKEQALQALPFLPYQLQTCPAESPAD